VIVRQVPFSNANTGDFGLLNFATLNKFFKALTGQNLWSGNSKRSIYSPEDFFDFGIFT
jgi:hypothetical protein